MLLGAGVASLTPEPPPDTADTTAGRVLGRLTRAPEWHGLGTYLDLQLQNIDGQEASGRARLTEFLDDPEQRQLFDALQLGSGDELEIVVKLHRPAVYRDPGGLDYRRHFGRQGTYSPGNTPDPPLIPALHAGWPGP